MRIAILLAIALVAGGVYLFGGRTITAEHVESYYQQQRHATMSRDPEGLCDLLARDFEGVTGLIVAGRLKREVVDRPQACASTRDFFESLKKPPLSRGGIPRLGYQVETRDIGLSSDGKTATVEVASRFTVSGQLLVMESTGTDTLVRRRWRTVMTSTDSTTTMTGFGR